MAASFLSTPFIASSQTTKIRTLNGHRSQLSLLQKPTLKPRKSVLVHAEFRDDGPSGGAGDFIGGFLLGGAIFGTLAYVFAPQGPYVYFVAWFLTGSRMIRRSLLNEDEHGFQRTKQPNYYDEGLETTRQTLNEKISQLNSAIDTVSSRLRGNNAIPDSIEVESEIESAL